MQRAGDRPLGEAGGLAHLGRPEPLRPRGREGRQELPLTTGGRGGRRWDPWPRLGGRRCGLGLECRRGGRRTLGLCGGFTGLAGLAFRDAYVTLLETVRSHYPDALIVCIIGPLLSGTDLTTIQGHIQDAVDLRTAAGDRKVEFFNQIATRFHGCDIGSKACLFSQAYVIAHEVGHHVQNLLGILPKAQQAQHRAIGRAEANHIQVQVELQADCLAGVWANRENEMLKSEGKPAFIEPGDVETALRTAAAIGDDTLQRRARGYVVPDSFTHGSSEQRQRWFNTGFRSGSLASCNTFAAAQL